MTDRPKVAVTPDCAGTGQCISVAPNVFRLDDNGLSTVDGEVNTPEQLAAARKAAALCPMAAITVED